MPAHASPGQRVLACIASRFRRSVLSDEDHLAAARRRPGRGAHLRRARVLRRWPWLLPEHQVRFWTCRTPRGLKRPCPPGKGTYVENSLGRQTWAAVMRASPGARCAVNDDRPAGARGATSASSGGQARDGGPRAGSGVAWPLRRVRRGSIALPWQVTAGSARRLKLAANAPVSAQS